MSDEHRRFFMYRNHSCGELTQNLSANFVEMYEIVTRCECFLHLGKSWVEMVMKGWYNKVDRQIVWDCLLSLK